MNHNITLRDDQVVELKQLMEIFGNEVLNMVGHDGYTPLNLASQQGLIETVEFLISVGADPNICNKKGDTPLINASRSNVLVIVKLLTNYSKTNLNSQDGNNHTALHWAVYNNNTEMVEVLVNENINSSLTTFQNEIALDVAKKLHREEIVKILENYFPSFQSLTKSCLRNNGVDVSKIPKIILA